jgi:hypothetical protein
MDFSLYVQWDGKDSIVGTVQSQTFFGYEPMNVAN